MRRGLASALTVLLLAIDAIDSPIAADASLRAFIGGARRGSDEDSPWSIYANFGTCGTAPSDGSSITIVPKDASLPTVIARIDSTVQIGLIDGTRGHDYGCLAFTSVVSSTEWRERLPSSIDEQWYQPIVVVLGTWPKAHIKSLTPIERNELPGEHRKEDLGYLLDLDGDKRADIGVWDGCNARVADCPPNRCQEVWTKKRARWRMLERRCVR